MKAYKFHAQPNLLVTDFESGKPLLRFNKDGEYITMDEDIKKRLAVYYGYDEISLESGKVEKQYKCKKCDFQTDDNTELMRHYRTEHPKE